MLITSTFSWPAVNWPTTASAASQYTLYSVYPGVVTALQNVSGVTSATLSFDDAVAAAYQVRPSSGGSLSPFVAPTSVGPECAVFTVGYVPCRAWLRGKVRKALADRSDAVGTTSLNWPDDELNEYISEGLTELNTLFPVGELAAPITLTPPQVDAKGNTVGVTAYTLPSDLYLVRTVEYVTSDEQFRKYLKEKPWRGGETTYNSMLGYPKLGVLFSPTSGRYYPGNYYVFPEGTLNIDWPPTGDGDYLNVTYFANRALPANDGDVLNVTPKDMELLSLYTQMKAWLRVEGQDVRLSRWRSKDDGSRRDDLPTVKQSFMIKQLYDQRVNDRREQRPHTRRLVRR